MNNFKTILFELNNGVATVWLNRPEIHNAFNNEMITEITDCFNKINNLPEVAVVILRGKGKSFCTGADLNWMKNSINKTYDQNIEESKLLYNCFYSIYTCNKPIIANIHGFVLGGANGIVSACDMAYCLNDTTFALSEVKIGIVPATISPFVIKRIGEHASKELMLTGRRINGTEAEKYNLVNKSFDNSESLELYVQNVIGLLLTSGPKAVTICKQLIFDVCNNLTVPQTCDYTAKVIADIRASEEGQEGMKAFLEKRKPNWIK